MKNLKTLTFTVEDALLSPIGFAVLSGAGLLQGTKEEYVHVHTTSTAYSGEGVVDLTDALASTETICETAPIFAVVADEDGSITGEVIEDLKVSGDGKKLIGNIERGKTLFVDFYIRKPSAAVSEIQIDAENFAGYYYVEATTLFRRQNDGVDMPAELTLPNVKIQSNFTFTMASTGDPSTFTFTMDAFPGYTYFNPTRKVLCAIQIVEDASASEKSISTVFPHEDDEIITESEEDSAINTDKPIKSSILELYQQNETIEFPDGLNPMPVSDLIGKDLIINEFGSVKGTMKYVKGFTDFSSNVFEQDGYFIPFKLGADMTGSTMSLIKNGIHREDKTNMPFDKDIVLRVDGPETVWEIEVKDINGSIKNTQTLYFSMAKFESKQ